MTKARDLGDFISDGTIAETVTADGLNLGDNEKIQLGASQDLQIYHDGTASYIHDNGVGSLKIRADQLRIESADGSETLAVFNQNSDVFLRHDNTTRLATTSTGVDVTGTVAVSGSFNATSGTFTVQSNGTDILNVTSTVMSPQTDGAISLGSATNGFNNMYLDGSAYVSGNVGIGTSSPTNTSGLEIQTSSTTAGLWVQTGGTTSSYNIAEFRTGSNLDALKIRGDGSSIFQGNVGIGTSSPSAKLDLQGTAAGNEMLEITHSGASQPWKFISGENGVTNEAFIIDRGASGEWLRFHAGLGTVFSYDNTERMRIDSSGNVGIGTSSPEAELHIAKSNSGGRGGTLVIENSHSSILNNEVQIAFLTDSGASLAGTSNARIKAINTDAGNGAAALTFTTWSGSAEGERMRIDSSGDVNIVNELKAGSYNETYSALSGTTPTVDCETGNVFSLSTTGNTTFTFTNPPASGTAYGFTLKVTAGGTHTLTWPASVDWAGGTAPDAPASGETNVLVFITYDGGTTWYGFQAGAALA